MKSRHDIDELKEFKLLFEAMDVEQMQEGEMGDDVDNRYASEREVIVLPPVIILNPRIKTKPAFIPQEVLFIRKKERKVKKNPFAGLMWIPQTEILDPVPKHEQLLSWWPNSLCFKINKKVIKKKLRVWNRSEKLMYIMYVGLWNDTAKLGAHWWVFPKKRIQVAPGLSTVFKIRAEPIGMSPIPFASAGLQLATNHATDTVVGYHLVTIDVVFKNYVP